MPLNYYTNENPDGRKIVLLDLVWTLAFRDHRAKCASYTEVILQHENYRTKVIDRLLEEEYYICIVTARSTRHEAATIASLRQKTNWVPDAAIFNELDIQPPPAKKHALDKYIYPTWGNRRGRFFVLESNKSTTAMYQSEGLNCSTWENWMGVRREDTSKQLMFPFARVDSSPPRKPPVERPPVRCNNFIF